MTRINTELNKVENDSHEAQIEATLSTIYIYISTLPSQTLKKKQKFFVEICFYLLTKYSLCLQETNDD